MKKLARFAILTGLYILSFIVVYTILPLIVWLFGGVFTDVSHSIPYVMFGTIFINVFLLFLFSECFDDNWRSK